MRVLYVNHTSQISGGERSLLDLLGGLPPDVSPTVACPAGPLADAVGELGVEWHSLPSVDASLRMHPIHTSMGLVSLATAAAALRRLTGRFEPDLVHANSVRAGLIAALATVLGGRAVIAHVRDCLPPGLLSSLTLRGLVRGASAIVANSEHTKRSIERTGTRTPIHVAYSPVNLDRFDPDRFDPADARARLNIEPTAQVLAVVAQLTPWKAQDDAVRIVARLKPTHPQVRLLLVGAATFVKRATRHDNEAYVRRLQGLIAAHELNDKVLMLGQRADVPAVLRATDVLLVPSWEEPFGRAVVEGMAMGLPVVATSVGGPAEIMSGEMDGLLLPPRQPERWAAEVESLLDDPQRRTRMGACGRGRILRRFSLPAHIESVLSVYRATLEGSPSGASSGAAGPE